MTYRTLKMARWSLMLLLGVAPAEAGTVHGTVKNGTTGKLASGVEVVLIQLQGSMQPIANVKSDAKGQFVFDNPQLGAQPMLVRAIYNGVNFHQPVPPGKSEIEIQVFEATDDPKTISVPSRVIFFQPSGATMIVGEEYSIANQSQPPHAYFQPNGNFEFSLPENARLQQVAASGPAGMPVVQSAIDRSKNRYAIAYAFRPGESTVRYSYEVPYPGNTATIKVPIINSVSRLLVVAPPSLQITGQGLQSGGQEQGMSIYGRENLAANTAVTVTVSGTAPPLSSSAGANESPQGNARSENAGSADMNIQQVPGRLDVLKWPLVSGFAALFAIGAVLLARKKVVTVPVGATQENRLGLPTDHAGLSSAKESSGKTLAELDTAVGNSLDALKEQLFRLELRRQAGTISEETYTTERAKAEQVIRDLVRS